MSTPHTTPLRLALLTIAFLFAAATTSAQSPYVVRDLIVGSGTSSAGSGVDETVMLGAIAIFAARDGINGRELWRSDGTVVGTYLLMDIRPGTEDSLPRDFVVHDGLVYFGADDGARGRELWRTDGTTAGTGLVRDIRLGAPSSNAQPRSSAGGKLYFNAADVQGGSEYLWYTDGTSFGAVESVVIAPCCLQDGSCVVMVVGDCRDMLGRWKRPDEVCEPGGCPSPSVLCCFPEARCAIMTTAAVCAEHGGTPAPLGQPCDDAAECLGNPVACCLYFGVCVVTTYSECLKAAGLPFIHWQTCESDCFSPEDPLRPNASTPVVEVNGTLLVGGPGFLWAIDAATQTVSALATFSPLYAPDLMTVVGDHAYFAARTDAEGRELWVTDGTPTGTRLVADINPGPGNGIETGSSEPTELIALDGVVLFQGTDGVNGRELWRSDGTGAGTEMVADLPSQAAGSTPRRFVIFDGEVFFIGFAADGSETLFRSDGTGAGTLAVKTGFDYQQSTIIVRGTRLAHGGLLYFSAYKQTQGRELWRTDGTEAGTILLRDEPGGGEALPGAMMSVGGQVVYAADRVNSGRELWQTDGTPGGTVFFADLNTVSPNYESEIQPGLGDVAFLMAPSPGNGLELFRTAGTAATTWMVKDIAPGTEHTVISEMVMFGGRLFFTATRSTPPAFSRALWSSDGTDAGTAPVGDLAPPGGTGGVDEHGIAFGGQVLFVGGTGYTGSELWKSDGTAAGTVQVREIRPGTLSGLDLPYVFAEFGGLVYFGANDGSHGAELWRTDGTAEGTTMFADLIPGTNGGIVRDLFVFGDVLLFTYSNTVWRTDGTLVGTFTLNAGSGPSLPEEYFEFNGAVYFRAGQGSSNKELWRTDGSLAGTVRVKDINPGTADSYPGRFTVHNGELLFTASSPTGNDIWRTDGTEAGTMLALDLANTTQPNELFVYNGQLYFTQTNSGRIWRTDLTPGGTVMLLSSGHSVPPSGFVEHLGILYFISGSGFPVTGGEIWRTDGTEAGTFVALDLVAGIGESNPGPLTLLGGQFIFSAQTAANGREYWSFNPTTLAAARLTDIASGTASSSPAAIAQQDGQLYFRAYNPNSGTALYRTDGSAMGTSLVLDPDVYHPVPSGANLTVVGDHLFFTDPGATAQVLSATAGTAATNVTIRNFPFPGDLRSLVAFDGSLFLGAFETGVGLELHRAESAEGAVSLVTDFFPGPTGSGADGAARVGGELFFVASPSGDIGRELCATDGSAQGTRLVRDIRLGVNDSNLHSIVDLNGIAVFVAMTDEAGEELWRSDGTEAGTFMLADIFPGEGSSAPAGLMVVGNRVAFTADDGVHGRELWSTNGTPEGTFMTVDIWEGPGGSRPSWMTMSNGQLFFTAYTPETGTELWTSNGSAFGTALVFEAVQGPSSAGVTRFTVAGSRLYFFATAAPAPTSLWALEWGPSVADICFADYDRSGGLGVADIFAFLSEWFAQRPRSDVDGDGVVAVADIFAFLTLWFESCA